MTIDDVKKTKEALGVVSTGDAAEALIFGTAGAMVDAAFNPLALLTWQQTGLLSASGALGIKKGIEKWRESKKESASTTEERRRAERLLKLLHDSPSEKHLEAARRLENSLKLFEAEIIKVDELKARVDEAARAYGE